MEEKTKKIIVYGDVSSELTQRIVKISEEKNIEVVYQPVEDGQLPYAIAEGFDPNPLQLKLPYLYTQPYLSSIDTVLEDIRCYPEDRRPYSKYAREITQAELDAPKINRNEPCPCGSGLKFKKCCRDKNLVSSNTE